MWAFPKLKGHALISAVCAEMLTVTGRPRYVVIEHQQAFGAAETQQYATNQRVLLYGRFLGALQITRHQVAAVAPQSWQAHFKLKAGMPKIPNGLSQKERTHIREQRHKELKLRGLSMARGLYGQDARITMQTADAVLIGTWGLHRMQATHPKEESA